LVLTHHADAKGVEAEEGYLPALKELPTSSSSKKSNARSIKATATSPKKDDTAKKKGAPSSSLTDTEGSSLDGPKMGSSEMGKLEEGGRGQDDASVLVDADPVPVSVARVDGMWDVYVCVFVSLFIS
jgi:hypothetical protein